MNETSLEQVMAQLAGLSDESFRAVNVKHGDDHAVPLGKLREISKQLKTQHALARQLWATGDSAARLLAALVCRPREFSPEDLDRMQRQARTPKVRDWLLSNVVKKSPHHEKLRQLWLADKDPAAVSAGWALTADCVTKNPERLDLPALLDSIEAQMKSAPDRSQWAMNDCLAQIGIEHAEHRARAIAIGERLGVFKDYPTPPGCTSPFAPVWITSIVSRRNTL